MRSIHSRLKKLKTHKRVCSLLFSLILGLGLFGGLSLKAFAQQNSMDVEYNTIHVPYVYESYGCSNPVSITVQNSQRYYIDFSYTILWRETYSSYNANLRYLGAVNLGAFDSRAQISGANGMFGVELLDVIRSSDNIEVHYANPTVIDTSSIQLGLYNITHIYDGSTPLGTYDYDVTFRYRVYYSTTNPLSLVTRKSYTAPTVTSFLSYTYDPSLTLEDILGYVISDLSIQDDIYDELDEANYTLDQILVALNGLSTGIYSDNSGVSDNLNAEVSSAAAVESAADGAITSALPDADNELDDILDYDYSTIGTDNLTALSFWKSLGDYILNNSNLVGIGALLIGCLFLGFVIYLLRL